MKTGKHRIFKLLLSACKTVICTSILINLAACTTQVSFKSTQFTNSQDANVYATQNFSIPAKEQSKLATDYLSHYFSPWHRQNSSTTISELENFAEHEITKFKQAPKYGANLQPYPHSWFEKIALNTDLQHFPNLMKRAITINDINARLIPSAEPIFSSPPSPHKKIVIFDDNQQSLIAANTPLFVLHVSQDGAWYFIITSNYSAWVPKKDIAFVDNAFIKKWNKKKFVTPLTDGISIFDMHNNFIMKTKVGEIYPLQKTTANYYFVLAALTNENQHAVIKIGKISRKDASIFPQQLTTKNIARLANTLIGKPYGWGGTLGYRDCSSTMMDLFAPFGIWLPRNSGAQVKEQNYINLTGLKASSKKQIIANQGIPFITLLHLPGHVVLYLGSHNGQIYILHNTWGEIHDTNIFRGNINIIGRTVITPISLRRKKNGETILDQIDAMRMLVL